MKSTLKIFSEWIKDLNVKLYSSSWRKLEVKDNHVKKLYPKDFIRLLKTIDFTFNNRNNFNRRLISFSHKYNIKEEHISRLLELRKDDYVKFKSGNKIQVGRYQGEINNGKELVEIEVNQDKALNYIYIEKNKISFPTKKEIYKVAKKELALKTNSELFLLAENYNSNLTYLNYYE